MMLHFALLYLHIIGAAVLMGTGAGIAFFMLVAHLDGKPVVIAGVARIVVIADFIFTATAAIAQPITGASLALQAGYSLTEGWLLWSIVLYIFTGALWLPVVWMQIRLRELASQAAANGTSLPDEYHRVFWYWCAFGVPAFAAVAIILWLMVAKPQIEF
jgi:uncharacterized membrane protein